MCLPIEDYLPAHAKIKESYVVRIYVIVCARPAMIEELKLFIVSGKVRRR